MSRQLALDVYSVDQVDLLRERLGVEWPYIEAARTRSRSLIDRIETLLDTRVPQDTTCVVFGSLARHEFTSGSDLDWTLLVDGYADPDHRDTSDRIESWLQSEGLRPPTPGGAFGELTFSHDLVHRIGGDDDTNHNTTQRLLLLLESVPVHGSKEHERVVRRVLTRYIEEDVVGALDTPYGVPRFLLNDVVRYWRTMAVDFADKRRDRRGAKWALRTAKLRMSRKLMYASGLLICYSCDFLLPRLDRPSQPAKTKQVVDHLTGLVKTTPLEVVAWVMLSCFAKLSKPTARLFATYDEFLGLLDDPEWRTHMEVLTPAEVDGDAKYRAFRKLAERFDKALAEIFFERDTPVRELTCRYGLF